MEFSDGYRMNFFFFFQAEDGIRDYKVTGVQTCALPISDRPFLQFQQSSGGFVSVNGAVIRVWFCSSSQAPETAKTVGQANTQSRNPAGVREQIHKDPACCAPRAGKKKVAGGCGCQPLVRLACALPPLDPSQRQRAQTEVCATRP